MVRLYLRTARCCVKDVIVGNPGNEQILIVDADQKRQIARTFPICRLRVCYETVFNNNYEKEVIKATSFSLCDTFVHEHKLS